MGTVAYYRHAWTDKIQRFIAVPEHGEEIFLAVFFFYMVIVSLQTTMFRVGGPIVTAVLFLLAGCVLFKIIAFDRYSEKELCFAALLLGDAVVVMALSGYKEVFYFAVFLLGAKNIDFEKILKIYMLVTIAVLLSAFVASRLDIIEDLVYDRAFFGERNSFGAIYPTDFAAHIFFLLCAWYYVIRKKLQTCQIVLGGFICAAVYYYCKTRLDCITMALLLLVLWVLIHREYWFDVASKRKKVFEIFFQKAPWFGVAGFAVMYLLSLFYMPNVSAFAFLNELISDRLRISNQGLAEYGFSLWGQPVEMNGNGGSLIEPANYFYIDSSFLYVYLCYGAVFLALILWIHYSCCKKYADDRCYLLILAVIAVNCMIAHHMVDLAYNPFYFALLAKRDGLFTVR